MPTKSPRRAALDILADVADGAYSNLRLNQELKMQNFNELDRRFITELVYGTLEKRLEIDWFLHQVCKDIPIGLPGEIVRMGAYQLLFMTKVQIYAACDESVKLCREVGRDSTVSFVNAVMRRLAEQKDTIQYPDEKIMPEEFLSVKFNYPRYLAAKLIGTYGEKTAKAIMAYEPTKRVCLRPNLMRFTPETFEKYLKENNITFEKGKLCGDAYYIHGLGAVYSHEGFRSGDFTVQGEGSMLAARCLNPQGGKEYLDACSAPGGKTVYLSELSGYKAQITAWDIHEHRTLLVTETVNRMGAKGIEVLTRDAASYREKMRASLQGVLIDAPCSGLGVLDSKPEIRYRVSEQKIKELAELQWNILRACSRYVRPGGQLVYSTCSYLPQENIDILEKFLDKNPQFIPGKIEKYLPASVHDRVKQGSIQLFPHIDGTDGFFIALLERTRI